MWPRNAAAPKPVNIPQANGVPNIDAPSPVRPPKPATIKLQRLPLRMLLMYNLFQ